MARKLGGPLDFQRNESQNRRIQQLASAPSSPVEGQEYYDTVTHADYVWNASAWVPRGGTPPDATTGSKGIVQLAGDLAGTAASPQIAAGAIVDADINGSAAIALSKLAVDPVARANHTGTQLAATISDFNTAVRTNRLDQMAAPTADVSMGSHKLTSVTDPTSAQDAATKAYVDSVAQGLDAKASVRVATAAAGTLASSFENGDTVDGIALVTGDRILIKDQAAPAENGIYTVNASGAPTRATDADTWGELISAFVFVEVGTANADNGFVSTVDAGGTLNTTAVTFTQFSGAGQITAGAALTKTGNTLDVAVDGSSIEVNADALRVKAGGITEAMLADNSVSLDDSQGTVTGTLAVANGGTGQTAAKAARETGLGAAGYYSNAATHGAGATITITQATHGLRATRALIVDTYDAATGDKRLDDTNVAASGDVVITFSASQSANSIGVVIVG